LKTLSDIKIVQTPPTEHFIYFRYSQKLTQKAKMQNISIINLQVELHSNFSLQFLITKRKNPPEIDLLPTVQHHIIQ
jgi:hypothetical protein